ncbi:heme ABC exporter ATP-binding protein CcmA [Stappia sp. F7233]|uniref:Heme ABC exporter ATP-binding protein CcmA n=1 Tax=Stappia albiluteola TaxID=2758565 RepID=A0A839AHS1_9HYPH|nr:heme ABC exporter ATP-binding protein CcmA [Stappia albiluteola]MBA5778626.1 heme ABC exporter ATP-binding protein CcmA [Stappia albiluteola]
MQLVAENLACDRGGRRVFAGVSLKVASGTALAVTGANGVGKSSLLRQLAGLVPVAEGVIRLEGGDDERPPFEHCHYFGHQDALKPSLSVAENLAFWQAFTASAPGLKAGAPARGVDEALEFIGLAHAATLPAAYLSAGQRRRLSLARLLVVERPVWLLDEPAAALDASSEGRLCELMSAHLEAGGLILAATHQPLRLANTATLHLQAAQ